ncbi:MAG: lysophospholipid acyltransferase family protein [Tenuifilum sp.]|uniref:lysophospholipid acyltransferase family protein n=1 Tax=Tenuifilum sp. TaxID=2760880 RepID=UPI001B423E5E|nr:lysophospholipid acyltransferase family protein [Bacteroidales bacterium]HOK60083.1 lysophospholipid acyltransferase family protein [Tenuifilum sp.]MBP9029501.1 lysophospholipid acyltransferase family protein [Bacteroidales bacterium]HOK84997.1 lysophospholipid acyltransferase family protein [Tenuifilum sp.]HON69554.1 lysophospholipid acyltransferase family protein [Tenuifilum sp.]
MITVFYFILFLISIVIVAIIPWGLIYGYSNLMAKLLHNVLKYRVRVTRSNLRLAFPEKSDAELAVIEKQSYQNLADISVEALKGFTMRNSAIRERHKILNPELLDYYYNQKQSIIGVAGHLNNWEWGALSAGIQLKHHPVAIYKPLSNKLIDWFIKWNRSIRGTELVPTNQTFDTFQKYKHKPCIYILVADQSPSNLSKAYWINFFNQDTACIHGPEKYAKMYNYPVIYIDIKRVKRGYYTVELSVLCDKPNELKDGELTAAYMHRLEQSIRENPESWLWTHRRWKRKRPQKAQ